jgi:hypothetical protein
MMLPVADQRAQHGHHTLPVTPEINSTSTANSANTKPHQTNLRTEELSSSTESARSSALNSPAPRCTHSVRSCRPRAALPFPMQQSFENTLSEATEYSSIAGQPPKSKFFLTVAQ